MAALHPNPQFARNQWTSLDGTWHFAEDPDDSGLKEQWYAHPERFAHRIVVPFPPESAASGIGHEVSTTMWYARRLDLPAIKEGQRRLLHFEGVDYRCDIWLNGQHITSHEGGQTGFVVDVSDVWKGVDDMVVVRAVDNASDLEQPRGKQDWLAEPHGIWYERTSGIWRSVWTEDVPEFRITSVSWTTPQPWGRVDVDLRVSRAPRPGATLELVFSSEGAVLASSSHLLTGPRLRASVAILPEECEPEVEALLWTPENPRLIDVEARLIEDESVDRVHSYIGLRTLGADHQDVLLNGRPYFLRLVLEQLYWPDTHLASPSDEALRREVELIKSLGFNGIRAHQVVADPRFLAWCDRLGLLVCADSAATYRFSALSLARTTREWIDIIERDRNHPSVIMWVPFNESWGVPGLALDEAQRWAVTGLHGLLKGLDPTRLVTGNDGWEYVAGDIVGIHDYSHVSRELEQRYRDASSVADTINNFRPSGRKVHLLGTTGARETCSAPALLTEFGGVSLASTGSEWVGYGQATTVEEFVTTLDTIVARVGSSSGLAGFCYTQLTDTRQEQNGLLDQDRVPKAPAKRLAAIFGG